MSVADLSAAWLEIDLRPESDLFDGIDWTDRAVLASAVDAILGDRTQRSGVTRHLTPVMMRAAQRDPGDDEATTVQVGVGLLTRAGEQHCAPLAGRVVHAGADGPIVLMHAGQPSRWTVWWGIESPLEVGDHIESGAPLGTALPDGDLPGLGAVVQVQVLLAYDGDPSSLRRWIRPSDVTKWRDITMDPAPVLGLASVLDGPTGLPSAAVIALRDERLARSQRAYYSRPPKLVRGRGVWLYDEQGYAYLDSINNVTHVGHAEPRVAAAAARQLRKLNTNSRFIYEGIATYAERIVSTLPAPLEVVFFVCTGSEANDLALRISRQVTGRDDVVVIDGAYHGNTAAGMGASPNRYKGRGGRGAPPTTHEIMMPDLYRGPFGAEDAEAGTKYGAQAAGVIRELVARDRPPAAFIAESLMGTAGNIVFPSGFLPRAFDAAREAGALCISDEVQVGVGRLGTHFWGFEAQSVVPDIVTMGKPLGNGHPIAAVVTTREIADAFDDGVKYFNTFAGNPVSCAIGNAVLDVVEGDGLQANARDVGGYLLDALLELKSRHELIGDVRGHGLYLGIELVRDRISKEPATLEALALSEKMKDHGVITYPTGVHDNSLKIKPPMVFSRADADIFVSTLDRVLTLSPRG